MQRLLLASLCVLGLADWSAAADELERLAGLFQQRNAAFGKVVAAKQANDGEGLIAAIEQLASVDVQIRAETGKLLKAEREPNEASRKLVAQLEQIAAQNHQQLDEEYGVLAELCENAARWADAEKARQRHLDLQAQRYGKESWQATDARIALALTRQAQLLTAADLSQLRAAFDLQPEIFGHLRKAEYEQALPKLNRQRAVLGRILGERHPRYASCINSLAAWHLEQGQYVQAAPLYQQALDINKETLGDAHPLYAAALRQSGLLYKRTADYPRALSLTEQSKALYAKTKGTDDEDYGSIVATLATIHDARGQYKEAEALYKEALDVFHGLPQGTQEHEYSAILGNLAGLYRQTARFADAERLYLQAVEIDRENLGPNHPGLGTSLSNLALHYHEMGDASRALEILLEAKKIYDDRGQSAPTVLGNLASVYNGLGERDTAEKLYLQVLQAEEATLGARHPSYAVTLSNLGSLCAAKGEKARAEQMAKQACEILEAAYGAAHPRCATAIANLADVYSDFGDHERAEPLLLQAVEITRKALGDQHPDHAEGLAGLAKLYVNTKEWERAEEVLRQALEIQRAALGDRHPTVAQTLNSLVVIATALDRDRQQRLRWLLDAREILKQQPRRDMHYAMNLMAEAHMSDFAQAEPLMREALALCEQSLGKENEQYAGILVHLAILHVSVERYAEAESLWQEAIELKIPFWRNRTEGQAASVVFRFHQQSEESILVDLLLSVSRRLPDTDERGLYAQLWRNRNFAEQTLRARRDLLSDNDEARSTRAKLAANARSLSRLTLSTVPPDRQDERRSQLRKLAEQKEELEQELARTSERYRQEAVVRQSRPDDLASLLPHDAALIEFIKTSRWEAAVGDPNIRMKSNLVYEAFVLRRSDGAPPWTVARVDLGPALPIDDAVTAWIQQIDRDQGEATSPDHPAQRLRERLWAPLEPHLQGIRQAVIVPDATLNFLPWGALPAAAPGSFLLEQYVLSTASSGRELYRQLRDSSEVGQDLVVIGGVDFNAGRAGGESRPGEPNAGLTWKELDGARTEVQVLKDAWPHADPPRVLSGADAHEAAVIQAMPRGRFIHFATHGFFADDDFREKAKLGALGEGLFSPNPLNASLVPSGASVAGRNPLLSSGIVLAGANRPPATDALGLPTGDDGILTAEEFSHVDLSGAELVVLSACDTGRGTHVAGGEGVFGLQRAFQLAGARHVVASLWRVNDKATTALMRVFYQQLWEEAVSPTKALRNAQLAILNHPELVDTLANDRGPSLRETVKLARAPTASAAGRRAPIRLWGAFTISGRPERKP